MAEQRSAEQRRGSKRGGFRGSTSSAYGSAILGAPFWKPGLEVSGFYTGAFETENGTCYKFKCAAPAKLTVFTDDMNRVVPEDSKTQTKEIDQFSIGALAGFQMAMDDMKANGWTGFQLHDRVHIKCTDIQEPITRGYSPMILFEVEVEP